MPNKIEIEYLTKDEIVKRYLKLQEEYADLEQQYNDLNDCYGELERQNSKYLSREEEYKELKESLQLLENYSLAEFLKELRFDENLGAIINKKMFKDYKEHFIELLRFYCADIPDDLYEAEYTVCKIDNEKVYSIIEELADSFEFSKSLK